MEIARRRLAVAEFDHELVWLVVSLASLGFATTWLAIGLPWPHCFFHDLTGLPCLTCGATRSAIAFFHGHVGTALKWNPLVFVTLCGLSIFNVYAFSVLILRAPRLRVQEFTRREKTLLRRAMIAFLLINWTYLLINWRAY
jgi:hypothetical protein